MRRVFLGRIWGRGVQLASGKTEDLDAMVRAVSLWSSGARLGELASAFPFMELAELAEAYEEGREVEAAWDRLEGSADPRIAALAHEARLVPRLAALFPYLTHSDLGFSRTTGYPFTRDAPGIRPAGESGYTVLLRDGSVSEADSARAAVAMVAGELPASYGPAVAGTADDLSDD
ncbi:DUF6193 family natural product biosynthesis protein [Streptomyces sp. NPDC054838]